MALMDSKESMVAAVKGTVQFIKKDAQTDEFCEDMLLCMIKTAYEKGREDVDRGLSSDILSMEPLFSHTF